MNPVLSAVSEGSGNVMQMTADTLRWGLSVPSAASDPVGRRRIPARPFLNVNQDPITCAAERLAQQIIKQLSQRAGGFIPPDRRDKPGGS